MILFYFDVCSNATYLLQRSQNLFPWLDRPLCISGPGDACVSAMPNLDVLWIRSEPAPRHSYDLAD